MSSDFVEVSEMWRLCVGNPDTFTSQVTDSVWIHLRMTGTQRWIIDAMGGKIYDHICVIIFEQAEDIVVFRLRAGV